MEGKQRLLQLLAFTTGPAIDVVQQYFEFKIIRQGTDFEDYLNDPQNKHKLFHERYPTIPCCECLRTTSIAAPSKRGCLGYQQFSKLYDENGTVTAGHEQTNRSKISQRCICKVSAQKSIKVIDIDLTLLNAIIQHCCNLHITKKIDQWMKDIKEVRNTVSHWSAGQLEKNMFDQTWKKLEKATLQCAGDIGHTSVKIFQMTIDSITTFSVDQLEKRILQTTDTLSKVHNDLNGIIPTVKSVLSKQIELCDQLCTQSKDLTEVKNLVSGVNTVVEQTKDVMEKVNIKTEESTNDFAMLKEDMGDVKYMLKQIGFKIGMKLQRQGEIHEDTATGKRKRSVTLDVEATSTDWDEKKTTLSLKDEMQALKERVDDDHHDDTEEFIIEKVENKCIHLELSASRDVFGSPQKLRKAIKSLIGQFVKAGELDGSFPATVNINITVNSALTTEEKTVVYTVFRDNTLDDVTEDREEDKQTPRLHVQASAINLDQQIASTSACENLYSPSKVRSHGLAVKRKRRKDAEGFDDVVYITDDEKEDMELGSDDVVYITDEENEDMDIMVYDDVETMKNVVGKSADTIIKADNSKKDLTCDGCISKQSLVYRLNDIIKEQRKTIMSLQKRKSTIGKYTDDFDDDYVSSMDDETLDTEYVVSPAQGIVEEYVTRLNSKGLEMSEKWRNIFDKGPEPRVVLEPLGSQSQIISPSSKPPPPKEPKAVVLLGMLDEKQPNTLQSSGSESVKDIQKYVINKEKALQKLGEILLIDMKIKEEQHQKKMQWSVRNVLTDSFKHFVGDMFISDLIKQRRERSGIVKTLTEIVSTSKNKIVTSGNKIFREDLDFLNLDLKSLETKCQQCGSQGYDIMTCVCTKCKRIFCDDCIREHAKTFTDHVYLFRDSIARGLECHGEIVIDYSESNLYGSDGLHVIDMKSVNGMVVIIMLMDHDFCLRVYNPVRGKQSKWNYQLKMELDKHKSQIAIIDENTVAITVPCKSHIYIVHFKTDMITKIKCSTDMTGAITVTESKLCVACTGHILVMNLQGGNRVTVSLPDIQFLHPVGQNKLYCVSSYNMSYLDMTNMEKRQLSEFPYHPVCLTSDDCSNIYFIFSKVVWKAAPDGTDCKVVLCDERVLINPKRICFDISSNLLLVLTGHRDIRIYRKV